MAKVNYTPDMVAKATEMYTEKHPEIGNAVVEDIAEAIGRSVRSVRSKLVREGVYVADEKPVKVERVQGPTKGEMLSELHSLEPSIDIDGLAGATKAAIQSLIDVFSVETEDEPEVE